MRENDGYNAVDLFGSASDAARASPHLGHPPLDFIDCSSRMVPGSR
jgi:hypothetical protein